MTKLKAVKALPNLRSDWSSGKEHVSASQKCNVSCRGLSNENNVESDGKEN